MVFRARRADEVEWVRVRVPRPEGMARHGGFVQSAWAPTQSSRLCMSLELEFAGQAFGSGPIGPMMTRMLLARMAGQATGSDSSAGYRVAGWC